MMRMLYVCVCMHKTEKQVMLAAQEVVAARKDGGSGEKRTVAQ